MGHDWRLRRIHGMTGKEWEKVARFLLTHTVDFVDSELVETDWEMKKFDLMLRILGEDGSVDGEGQKRIADAYEKLARDRNEFHLQQDNVEDKLEARDCLIVGLKEELKGLSMRRDSSNLEKLLADKTLTIAMFVAQADRLDEKKKAAEQRADEAEEKAEEKWRAWVEKEVQVKAGKAVSAERKKWQAKGKALPVETVTTTTQTNHIQELTVIQMDDSTQTEVALEELEKEMEKKREEGEGESQGQ